MSLADLRALSNITPAELADLRRICYNDGQEVNGHTFYKGIDTKKYSKTTFQLRNTRFQMNKAQLSLFLKIKEDDSLDMDLWGDEMCVSHLCHSKTCIKAEHLNLETMEQNRDRDECVRRRNCQGHKNLPMCIL